MKIILPTTALAVLALSSTPALAAADGETFELLPSDPSSHDLFGFGVATDGSLALVGSVDDDDGGDAAGAAYLFDVATGQQLAKWISSDASTSDFFGMAVAIDQTTAAVSAPFEDSLGSDTGAVYVFDTATGQEQFRLVPADAAPGDEFGRSVALSGGRLVAGSWRHDGNGIASGSAYVFDTSTGQELVELLPADGSAGDVFGLSAALSGDTALIGAPNDDDNGSSSGSAYLFDVTTGQQLAKLLPDDGAMDDRFGSAVAIHGTLALVGAYHDDDQGSISGSAYLFDVTTGRQIAKLQPDDGAAGDAFGSAVALHGQRALVGAPFHNGGSGSAAGAAYVFDTSTGKQIAKLQPAGLETSSHLGTAVSLDGASALVGATGGGPLLLSGAAYLFDVGPVGASTCGPAVPNSSGGSAVIVAYGSGAAADNCLRLFAAGVATNQFGYFLVSDTPDFTQPPGSQGNLCLGGTIGRYVDDVAHSGTTGSFLLELDLTNLPLTPPHAVQSGETWIFQAWFRDVNPTPTSNFTDAVSITFS